MRDCVLESSDPEMDIECTVDNCFSVSCQCNAVAKRVNKLLGCMKRGISKRSRELVLSLKTALLKLLPEYCVCSSGICTSRKMWKYRKEYKGGVGKQTLQHKA